MTDNEIRAHVEWWQHTLNLDHWKIDVQIVGRDQMDKPFYMAQVHRRVECLQAVIRARSPGDLSDCEVGLAEDDDLEVSLVHELLHIWMGPHGDDETNTHFEQGLTAVARVLVGMRRTVPAR